MQMEYSLKAYIDTDPFITSLELNKTEQQDSLEY
jgi:hypothetical protein